MLNQYYVFRIIVVKKQPYKTDNSSKQIQKTNSTKMEIKTFRDFVIILTITISAISAGIPGLMANNIRDTDLQYVREYLYKANNSETWLSICVDKISLHAINLVCGEMQGYTRTNLTNMSDYISSESVMFLCEGNETNLKECEVEKISSCSNVLYNLTCVSCTESRKVLPCTSNQTCHNQTKTCQCQTPFYGNNCQFLGTECPVECLNGGTCSFADGTCLCPNGYEGSRCEQRICIPACKNGGVCVSPNQCQCNNGTYGELCENIDIFKYELMIGLPLAGLAFFICVLSCMLVMLIIQCRKLMKYKCVDLSLCKKKKTRKEKKSELGRKDYENMEVLLSQSSQIPLTYVPNQGRISEALYDTLEVRRDTYQTTNSTTGYTTMQLRYGYENAEMVLKQELERRNTEDNARRPSYIMLN